MPPWPIAMPSSTAIVLNSLATPPVAATDSATISPTLRRWTWPGTNWVKEFAIATIGLPKSDSVIPVARQSARAPAMFRPWVEVRDRSAGMVGSLLLAGRPSLRLRVMPVGDSPTSSGARTTSPTDWDGGGGAGGGGRGRGGGGGGGGEGGGGGGGLGGDGGGGVGGAGQFCLD